QDIYLSNDTTRDTTAILGSEKQLVPASALVTITDLPAEPEYMRENLRSMAIVTGRVENRGLRSAIDDVRKMLAAVKLPVGYTIELGGQYESQRQAFRELLIVSGV